MLTGTDDIDVLVSNWSNIFSLIIEKHAPMTAVRVSEKYPGGQSAHVHTGGQS